MDYEQFVIGIDKAVLLKFMSRLVLEDGVKQTLFDVDFGKRPKGATHVKVPEKSARQFDKITRS